MTNFVKVHNAYINETYQVRVSGDLDIVWMDLFKMPSTGRARHDMNIALLEGGFIFKKDSDKPAHISNPYILPLDGFDALAVFNIVEQHLGHTDNQMIASVHETLAHMHNASMDNILPQTIKIQPKHGSSPSDPWTHQVSLRIGQRVSTELVTTSTFGNTNNTSRSGAVAPPEINDNLPQTVVSWTGISTGTSDISSIMSQLGLKGSEVLDFYLKMSQQKSEDRQRKAESENIIRQRKAESENAIRLANEKAKAEERRAEEAHNNEQRRLDEMNNANVRVKTAEAIMFEKGHMEKIRRMSRKTLFDVHASHLYLDRIKDVFGNKMESICTQCKNNKISVACHYVQVVGWKPESDKSITMNDIAIICRKCSQSRTNGLAKLKQIDKDKLEKWLYHFGFTPTAQCRACEDPSNKLHICGRYDMSHNIADALGGTSDHDNVIPTHAECNGKMGTKTFEEYRELVLGRKLTVPEQSKLNVKVLVGKALRQAAAILSNPWVLRKRKRPKELDKEPIPPTQRTLLSSFGRKLNA